MSNYPRVTANGTFSRKLDAIGWSLFFIWIGIAIMAGLGWGLGLLGVAAIVLLVQTLICLSRQKVDAFMVTFGLVMLAGALWDIFAIAGELMPVLLMVLGGAMLVHATFAMRPGGARRRGS